jgi:ribonucleoside-diphosphate reductase alpha chain
MKKKNTVKIDLSRDSLFDELGLKRLKDSYMRPDEVSPQERFAYVAQEFGSNEDHAQRLYDYASKHWLSFSTPVLAYGKDKKAMPISCFLPYMSDSAAGLVDTLSETNWLSMMGGGVGISIGIRATDGKSTGVMPHLKVYDASCLAYKQGTTRRGSYAMYLDIDHPDIVQFLEMRKPTGDPNQRCLNLHHGINITNKFMLKVQALMTDKSADDNWELVNPSDGKVYEVVSAKALWQKILELRMLTGEPYLHFIDTTNDAMPEHLKELGLRCHGSNLCSEITLPQNEERTAVCCLSSVNLEYWDEWKDNPVFLADIAEMLDNVLEKFITEAPDVLSRAVKSATSERSIGVGALGFHALLQKKGVPFESPMAIGLNKRVFKHIREGLDNANKQLAGLRGSCPDALATGRQLRFSHVMAIAPNASSSIIMGNTSPSIEPFRANAYRQDTLSGSSINRNRFLDDVLNLYAVNKEEAWQSIVAHDGSVQHLEWMQQAHKDVFKTAMEIDQHWVVQHAADRQEYIDQAQSVNLFFRPEDSISYINAVHFQAWKKGLKTLYYCRSEKLKKADSVNKKIERIILNPVEESSCLACEG